MYKLLRYLASHDESSPTSYENYQHKVLKLHYMYTHEAVNRLHLGLADTYMSGY